MGWAGGARLAEGVIAAAFIHLKASPARRVFVRKLFDLFTDEDADTLDEIRGRWREVDEVLDEFYPEEDE